MKPHIIFFLVDDLGYADVGFNGGKEIATPHIDALASSGARLTHHYVQPVCSPTRAAFLTGRYPMRHGLQTGVVRPWAQYGLPLEERTLAQALKDAGYETAIVGKWHLGHFQKAYLPMQRGFDHQYGHYNGAIDYFTHVRDGGFDWHRDEKECRDEGYTTHLLAREAIRRIEERDKAKPLFLYLPFNGVHTPLQVPDSYKKPYASLPQQRSTYAGMLAAVDEAIGQVLAALEAAGMRKDTLILFSSDNGGPNPRRLTDNGILRGAKGSVYEGGVRAAACVSWQGRIRPGTTIDHPIHLVDWYPTLSGIVGAPKKQKLPVDGVNVLETLTKNKPPRRESILLNAAPNTGAIRVGDWKLVLNGTMRDLDEDDVPTQNTGRKPTVELFDLKNDPREQMNRATENPKKVQELLGKYEKLARQAVPPKAKPRPSTFKTPRVWGEEG